MYRVVQSDLFKELCANAVKNVVLDEMWYKSPFIIHTIHYAVNGQTSSRNTQHQSSVKCCTVVRAFLRMYNLFHIAIDGYLYHYRCLYHN